MRLLLSYKNLAKLVLLLSLCLSTLFSCKESVEVNKNDKLEDLFLWNNKDSINEKSAAGLLENSCMYFKITKEDSIFKNNNNLKKIHAYAAYENNVLKFYLIDSTKDVIGSSNLNKNLYKYDVEILDTTKFISQWNSNNVFNSKRHSNITKEIAWNRVAFWNDINLKNTWIESKYSNQNYGNDSIAYLNPIFSVFEINVSDIDPLKDHYCFLAVGVESLKPKSPLKDISADLIIVNLETSTVGDLVFNVEDLVHSIPPCKKNVSQCNIPKFGVLNEIILNKMH